MTGTSASLAETDVPFDPEPSERSTESNAGGAPTGAETVGGTDGTSSADGMRGAGSVG